MDRAAQLKSHVQCPKCNKVSITFDPSMFVSVPLPTVVDKVQEIMLVPAKQDQVRVLALSLLFTPTSASAGVDSAVCSLQPITIYGATISTMGRIADLKKAVQDLSGVPAKRMIVADVWHNRIYRFLEDDGAISEIRSNDKIYVYEVPALDDMKDPIPVQVLFQKVEGR